MPERTRIALVEIRDRPAERLALVEDALLPGMAIEAEVLPDVERRGLADVIDAAQMGHAAGDPVQASQPIAHRGAGRAELRLRRQHPLEHQARRPRVLLEEV